MALNPIVGRMVDQLLSLLVENQGEVLFASDRDGLASVKDAAFDHPNLLDGSDVALPAVGLAAAYLLIYANVGRVFTRVMTFEARSALNEEGIEHQSKQAAKKLPDKYGALTANLDERARKAVTPAAFIEDLRRHGI